MKRVYSSGGVVYIGNSILMLQKINGDWVLPKGKIEQDETSEETAVREVKEEAGVKAKVLTPIGETSYRFKNYWSNNHIIEKKVSYSHNIRNKLACTFQFKTLKTGSVLDN